MTKMTKNSLCRYIIWLQFLVHRCKMMIPPVIFHFSKFLVFRGVKGQNQCVGNKANGQISKRVFQENKACHIFRRKIISYSLICTFTCTYQVLRNVRFSENLTCFVFLKQLFLDLPFCLITDEFQSILHYISGTVDHIIEILIVKSTGAFLYFFKKSNIVNIRIIVFYWPTSTVFLVNIYFSSSSINAKKKFWGVPHLYMRVILLYYSLFCIMLYNDLCNFICNQLFGTIMSFMINSTCW